MPIEGLIPERIFSLVVVATVFTVMFDLGLTVERGEFRWVLKRPGLLLKSLFSVLVAVPLLVLAVARGFGLPHAQEIGMMLMAIAPGAPMALRRSLDAGGRRSFATALQIGVAVLAIISMPLWIAGLDEFYASSVSVAPERIAEQVFVVQLLPLGLGMLVKRLNGRLATRLAPALSRLGKALLIVLVVLAVIDVGEVVFDAGLRLALAIATATALVLTVGHLLGGPEPATRTATAISSAARNPGLALLVAALNNASPPMKATVLAYLIVSALTLVPYVAWRRRALPVTA